MRVAIIGDVHLLFDDVDVQWFNDSDYDALLFVGDLAAYTQGPGLEVADRIAKLSKRTLLIPGNHDGVHVLHLAAEVFHWNRLRKALGGRQAIRCERIRSRIGNAEYAGYSLHRIDDITIIAARPHSLGGPRLAFSKYLAREFSVRGMEDSARLLCKLVDEAETDQLVFLAHNGPIGLGEKRTDIWGCDFRPEEGDFGDPDLRIAIDHALAVGKRVQAVVAGHMHHSLRGDGGERQWNARRAGVLYVNSARVPRIFRRDGRLRRHHVLLTLGDQPAQCEEVLV